MPPQLSAATIHVVATRLGEDFHLTEYGFEPMTHKQHIKAIHTANFAARFLPSLVSAYQFMPGPCSSYTSALILLMDSPYFVKYIRRPTMWFNSGFRPPPKTLMAVLTQLSYALWLFYAICYFDITNSARGNIEALTGSECRPAKLLGSSAADVKPQLIVAKLIKSPTGQGPFTTFESHSLQMGYKRAQRDSDYDLDLLPPPPLQAFTPEDDNLMDDIRPLERLPALFLFPAPSTTASGSGQPSTPRHRPAPRADSLEPPGSSPMSIINVMPLKLKKKRGRPAQTPETRRLRQTVRKLGSSQYSPDKRKASAAAAELERKAAELAIAKRQMAVLHAEVKARKKRLAEECAAKEAAEIQATLDAEDTRRAQEVVTRILSGGKDGFNFKTAVKATQKIVVIEQGQGKGAECDICPFHRNSEEGVDSEMLVGEVVQQLVAKNVGGKGGKTCGGDGIEDNT
ncbi:hypothetical protein B0H19DRAFT_1056215 [Mycena capillaripes]|nr:hypothetical protein B0H19DRAFT_1056215 [Mycena capillaripes]